jgi:hypothetical protein
VVSRASSIVGFLVQAALVAACSFSPAGPGGNVGVDAAGDDENDGGGGIDADDDIDDDGVPNASDNCPRIANPPPQRDHDADGIGDPCDPCPHRPSSEGSGDADGDGVGDACDPRPGARDRITLFDGFYDMGDDWTFVGTWDHDPAGFVRHAGNAPMAEFAVLPRSFDPPYFIESGVVVDSISMATTPVARQAGVAFAASEALDGFYLCSVRDDQSTTPAPARAYIARFATIDQPAENSSTNLADDLATGSSYRVRASHTTTEQGCVGTLGATSGSPVLAATIVPGAHVALRTFGMAVRFDYLVVYQPAP